MRARSAPRSRGLLRGTHCHRRTHAVGPTLAGTVPWQIPSPPDGLTPQRTQPAPDLGQVPLPAVLNHRLNLHVRVRFGESGHDTDNQPWGKERWQQRIDCSTGLLPIELNQSSPSAANHRRSESIGPALAGIAPAGGLGHRAHAHRPRARGDRSCTEPVLIGNQVSAPRSRGSLLIPRGKRVQLAFGPALAGMVQETSPSHRWTTGSWSRRGCEQGGHEPARAGRRRVQPPSTGTRTRATGNTPRCCPTPAATPSSSPAPSANAPQSTPAPPTGTASRTADNTPEPGTGTTSGKLASRRLLAVLPLGTVPRARARASRRPDVTSGRNRSQTTSATTTAHSICGSNTSPPPIQPPPDLGLIPTPTVPKHRPEPSRTSTLRERTTQLTTPPPARRSMNSFTNRLPNRTESTDGT